MFPRTAEFIADMDGDAVLGPATLEYDGKALRLQMDGRVAELVQVAAPPEAWSIAACRATEDDVYLTGVRTEMLPPEAQQALSEGRGFTLVSHPLFTERKPGMTEIEGHVYKGVLYVAGESQAFVAAEVD